MDTGYLRTLLTRLHIHVFYLCTLVYTCNSNLVPNTSAVYFISTYTDDFTVILRSFSRMREQIAPGRFLSPGPRLRAKQRGARSVSNRFYSVMTGFSSRLNRSIQRKKRRGRKRRRKIKRKGKRKRKKNRNRRRKRGGRQVKELGRGIRVM